MNVTDSVRQTYELARDRNVTLLAASFAYYAFVSLFPLALLALAVGSLLGGEALAQAVVSRVGNMLSESGTQILRDALSGAQGRTGAGLVGIVFLAWSGLKVFRGVDTAFTEVYGVERDGSIAQQVFDGLVVVVLSALAIVLMIAVGAALRFSGALGLPYPNLLGGLVLLAGLVAVFLPLYYVMPPVDLSVRDALPGAVVAAVGWVVLQGLFQLYTAHADKYEAYGLIGAILLFLTWLYIAGVLLFLGAVVNVILDPGRRP